MCEYVESPECVLPVRSLAGMRTSERAWPWRKRQASLAAMAARSVAIAISSRRECH